MNSTTKELALAYAQALVEYYEALNSDWSDKQKQVNLAWGQVYLMQDKLALAAEAEAKAMV